MPDQPQVPEELRVQIAEAIERKINTDTEYIDLADVAIALALPAILSAERERVATKIKRLERERDMARGQEGLDPFVGEDGEQYVPATPREQMFDGPAEHFWPASVARFQGESAEHWHTSAAFWQARAEKAEADLRAEGLMKLPEAVRERYEMREALEHIAAADQDWREKPLDLAWAQSLASSALGSCASKLKEAAQQREAARKLWEAATEHWSKTDEDTGEPIPLAEQLDQSSVALPGASLRGKDLYWIGVELGFIEEVGR